MFKVGDILVFKDNHNINLKVISYVYPYKSIEVVFIDSVHFNDIIYNIKTEIVTYSPTYLRNKKIKKILKNKK